jgi:hypothetical protein
MRTRAGIGACLMAGAMTWACGGGGGNPARPSAAGLPAPAGATITGTVNGIATLSSSSTTSQLGPTSSGAPSGLTVAIVGSTRSAPVDAFGAFRLEDVPSGTVQLEFTYGSTTASGQVPNVQPDQLIRVRVTLSGTTAAIVEEDRATGRVALCHSTGTGHYQPIEVSVAAEPAHRAHGDGKIGDSVPADPEKVFGSDCQPAGASVRIEKSTNGEDADDAPGPALTVGALVTWRYVVTNTGTVALTSIVVSDDRGVSVNCNGQTTLEPGQSMTCTGSGTAAVGQYRNVGTVEASWTGGDVEDSDASHYYGVVPTDEEEPGSMVDLCHLTGVGFYVPITVNMSAVPAHLAHGDGRPGELVPGGSGKRFTASCGT